MPPCRAGIVRKDMAAELALLEVVMEFMIPMGELHCPVCKRSPEISEEFIVIVRAGSAWKPENVLSDGRQFVPFEDGAEMYRVQGYCPEHAPLA